MIQEYKADPLTAKFIYSFIDIPFREYDKLLIFPDGADYILISSKGDYTILKKQVKLQYFEIANESLFVIRLKPFTLKLLDDKGYLFKSQMISLYQKVFHSKSLIKQMELIYKHLFSDIYILDKKSSNIVIQTNIIQSKKGYLSVESLAKQFNISVRTLQRDFKKYINLTPKEYISIVRIQNDISKQVMVEFLKTGHIPKYYTDYSHFHKQFKKYTTISPKHYYTLELQYVSSIYDII